MTEIVAGNSAFAMELYNRERAKPGNLFFSPYSISTALAMTYIGARGQTASEMAQALHLSLPQPEVPAAFSALVTQMEVDRGTKTLTLDIANSLWCQKGFPFVDSFLTNARDDFGAEAQEMDFAKNAEPSRLQINSWVAQKTQDKIKDLLQPGQVTADTRLVLCNAIYFKGQWRTRFEPSATHSAPFMTGSGQQVQVPLMTKTFRVRSRAWDDVTVFELPYLSNELSMVIVLPKAVDGLPAIEQKMNSASLHHWLTSLDGAPETRTEVFLPKFTLKCRLELTPTLSAMGMSSAFSAKADFSGISGLPGLCISDVVHQAVVEVNEEGTEAAAATGTIMRLTASVEKITTLRVDHPFLFFIRENRTGSILFLGRVTDPSKG